MLTSMGLDANIWIAHANTSSYWFFPQLKCFVGNPPADSDFCALRKPSTHTGVTYVLALNANGGICADMYAYATNSVPYAELPTPTKENYDFLGWFDENDNEVTPETLIYQSMTLTAQWALLLPEAPENLRVVYGNGVAFNAVENAVKYNIYLDGTLATTTKNTLYCFQNLTADTAYEIGVAAVFADGTVSEIATVNLTAKTVLARPTGLTRNGSTLSWNAVSGATKYRVWVIDADTNQFVTSNAKVAGTSYTFKTLQDGMRYQFRVCAIDANGTYGKTTTTAAFAYTAPTAVAVPTNFRAVYGNCVAWNATENAVKYNIYVDGKLSTGTNNVMYCFQSLAAGQTYEIGVAAVFADGTISETATVNLTAKTMLSRPTGLTRNGSTLSWNAVSGAVKYRVWVIDAETNRFVTSNAKVTGTSYTFKTLTAGKRYQLRVCAIDADGTYGKTVTTAAFLAN